MRLARSLILVSFIAGMQAFAQTDTAVQDSNRRDLRSETIGKR
jgi:Ni/Co efflux regulator RcnB